MSAWDMFSLVDYVTDLSDGQTRPVPDGWKMRNDEILESPTGVWLIEHDDLTPPGWYTIAVCDDPDDWRPNVERIVTMQIADPDMIGVAIAAAVAVEISMLDSDPSTALGDDE